MYIPLHTLMDLNSTIIMPTVSNTHLDGLTHIYSVYMLLLLTVTVA